MFTDLSTPLTCKGVPSTLIMSTLLGSAPSVTVSSLTKELSTFSAWSGDMTPYLVESATPISVPAMNTPLLFCTMSTGVASIHLYSEPTIAHVYIRLNVYVESVGPMYCMVTPSKSAEGCGMTLLAPINAPC